MALWKRGGGNNFENRVYCIFPRKWVIPEKKESDVTQTMIIENLRAEIR